MRAILVPIKSFGEAKLRLSGVLGPHERGELARELATRVFSAAGDAPVYVACDDGEVADWAVGHETEVLFTPHLGLSGAVRAAVEHLGERGATLVVVAHADLPQAHALSSFGDDARVTLAPDHHLDGTNVIAVPPGRGFRFAYGKGSYARHRAEAERLGLRPVTRYDPRLSADVDEPADLARIPALLAGLGTSAAVRPP